MRYLTFYTLLTLSLLFAGCKGTTEKGDTPSPQQVEADSLADIMYGHFDAGEYADCVEWGPKVADHYMALGDSAAVSDVYGTMGIAYLRLGNMTSAMHAVEQGIHIDSLLGDPELLSSNFNTLAGIYLADGQLDQAKVFEERALEYEKQTPDSPNLSNRYGIASEIYARSGEGDKAVEMATKGLDVARQRGDSAQIGTRLSQLGDAYMAAARYAEAERTYLACDSLLTALIAQEGGAGPSLVNMAVNLKQLGNVYERQNRIPEAISYYERSTELARQLGYKMLLSQTTQALGELYPASRATEAIAFLRESRALADTLHNHHEEEMMTGFAAQYELKDKAFTIERQAASIRAHRRALIVGGVVSLLVVAALGLYIYLLRLHRRHEIMTMRYSEKVVKEGREAAGKREEQKDVRAKDETTKADATKADNAVTGHSAEDEAFTARLAEYVEAHLSDASLSVNAIADEFCVSPRQFARRMKEVTGIDTTHYIRAARIMRARRLLATTDLPMQDIAFQCGFETPNYFSRVFRQSVGQSPSEYRKEKAGNL